MDSKSFQEEVKQLRSKKLGLLDKENNKIELHVYRTARGWKLCLPDGESKTASGELKKQLRSRISQACSTKRTRQRLSGYTGQIR